MRLLFILLFFAVSLRADIRVVRGPAGPDGQLVYRTQFGVSVVDVPRADIGVDGLQMAEWRYLPYDSNRFLPFFTPNGFQRNSYNWNIWNSGEPNVIRTTAGQFHSQYPGLFGADMNVLDAWAVASSWDGTICVLDTGVATNHPDLSSVLPGVTIQFTWFVPVGLSQGQSDVFGHGTFIAGLIAAGAQPVNGSFPDLNRMTGIVPGCKILPASIDLSLASEIIGIDWAVTSGAKIVNCSWGWPIELPELKLACQFAASNGVLLVCAARNDRVATPDFPIGWAEELQNIIGVTALNPDGTVSTNAAIGSHLVAAPGVSLASCGRFPATIPYVYGNGTSFAAPQMCGVAALMWANDTNATPYSLRQRLLASLDPLPDVAGGLNAEAAVGPLIEPPPPPCPNCPVVRPAFQPLVIGQGLLTINRTNTVVIEVSDDLVRWHEFANVLGPTSFRLDSFSENQKFFRLKP